MISESSVATCLIAGKDIRIPDAFVEIAAGRSNISPGTAEEYVAKAKKLKPVDAADLAEDQAQEAARTN